MSKKITRSDLSDIIAETVYEMLIENDPTLVNLMLEVERLNGGSEKNINEWLQKTTSVLEERLNIEVEKEVISEESVDMIRLSGIINNNNEDKNETRKMGLKILESIDRF